MAERGLALRAVTVLLGAEGPAALSEVSAELLPGRVSLVAGATGAGKSTLLGVLGGLIRPTAGEVLAEGEPVSRWVAAHRDRWRRQVGLVLQRPRLLDGLSALENVMARRLPEARCLDELRREATEALELAGALPLSPRRVETLSGGQRQRVELARALAGRPRYLLLDEPTAHQDGEGVARVLAICAEARGWGAVVVVASHDPRLTEAAEVDDPFRLVEGRLTRVQR